MVKEFSSGLTEGMAYKMYCILQIPIWKQQARPGDGPVIWVRQLN